MAAFYLKRLLFSFLFLITFASLYSQVNVSGTVYDITKKTPVEAVSVISTGGVGTTTDALGRYTINVRETDSIYFSYQNRPTPKYPITVIGNLAAFDISIMIRIAVLPTVFVKPRSYILDSLQNRHDYSKIFGYQKPGLKSSMSTTPGGIGAGLDLGELIGMFNFKKIRRTLSFQNRLLEEEQDKYINHRFSKSLVRELTGLESPGLETFMKMYRPPYEVVLMLNELELGKYIQDTHKRFLKNLSPNEE